MIPVKLFLFSLIAIWMIFLQVEAAKTKPSSEYLCGHLGKNKKKLPVNQPHYHEYTSDDFVGHFKIRQDKYTMHRDENRRKEACCAAKAAIYGAYTTDPGIFECLLKLWNIYCKEYIEVC